MDSRFWRFALVGTFGVVPFYNKEESIPAFLFITVMPILDCITPDYEIVYMNDGSTDTTLDCLQEAAAHNFRIFVIDLSRNFGKGAALTANLNHAKRAAIIPFDVY